MISWIVASHDPAVLEANLLATLKPHDDDEVVIVWHAESIAVAYNEGQARSTRPLKVYIHHDVRVLDNDRLRSELLAWCLPWVGIVGLNGSKNRCLPWWTGSVCGSVTDARMGRFGSGRGGEAAYLDGFLLASAQTLSWDESYPGWHLYDHDICEQMLRLGVPNWCIADGHELVQHNTTSSFDVDAIGWSANAARFREKWGNHGAG